MPATIQTGDSTYCFTPSSKTQITARVEFDHPLIVEKQAQWDGDPDDFINRIAPARTFGFRRDAMQLRQAGRAQFIDPRVVVVLNDDGSSESAPAPDECVRHKLLDLIGDLTIAGGVPIGTIEATRPGHRATHAALSIARTRGILAYSTRGTTGTDGSSPSDGGGGGGNGAGGRYDGGSTGGSVGGSN